MEVSEYRASQPPTNYSASENAQSVLRRAAGRSLRAPVHGDLGFRLEETTVSGG